MGVGIGVWGVGFGVWGLGFRVALASDERRGCESRGAPGKVTRVQGLGGVSGLGGRIYGRKFAVQGLGFQEVGLGFTRPLLTGWRKNFGLGFRVQS